jgi:hypothetical protein
MHLDLKESAIYDGNVIVVSAFLGAQSPALLSEKGETHPHIFKIQVKIDGAFLMVIASSCEWSV